jgi:hypothetical protein
VKVPRFEGSSRIQASSIEVSKVQASSIEVSKVQASSIKHRRVQAFSTQASKYRRIQRWKDSKADPTDKETRRTIARPPFRGREHRRSNGGKGGG